MALDFGRESHHSSRAGRKRRWRDGGLGGWEAWVDHWIYTKAGASGVSPVAECYDAVRCIKSSFPHI
ncbi:hypothetical protein O3P69_010071 [Scylla paramamosain]|uniref:Uncharacterized protein n=1 Tax=Scylla paramamosain TaxID=85552 RepID=A0AAW0SP51_SCYPA